MTETKKTIKSEKELMDAWAKLESSHGKVLRSKIQELLIEKLLAVIFVLCAVLEILLGIEQNSTGVLVATAFLFIFAAILLGYMHHLMKKYHSEYTDADDQLKQQQYELLESWGTKEQLKTLSEDLKVQRGKAPFVSAVKAVSTQVVASVVALILASAKGMDILEVMTFIASVPFLLLCCSVILVLWGYYLFIQLFHSQKARIAKAARYVSDGMKDRAAG